MMTIITVLYVIVCILLVITVLLQFGKGAEMGAIMGGGASQAVFSSSAKGNFMSKLTTVLAIMFMVGAITLTILKSKESKRSLFDNEAPVAAPLNSDAQALEKKDGAAPATPEATTTAPAANAVTPAAPAEQPKQQ